MAGEQGSQEGELIERVAAGDRNAFAQLVEPLAPRLFQTAYRLLGSRHDAEDAVQNALASAWLARARLDPARPALPMLTTITLNKCRDQLRRRKAMRLFGLAADDAAGAIPDDAPSPATQVDDQAELERTHRAIRQLPVRLQEALTLVTLDGHSQKEAAQLLGVSEKAIETRIYRARAALREKLNLI